MTLYRAEAGSAALALGTLVGILQVLGLAADLRAIARDDRAQRLLQDQALSPRRRARSAKTGDLPESDPEGAES